MAPTTRALSDAGRGADWQIFPADENDDDADDEAAAEDGVVEAARKSCAADMGCC